MRKYSKLFISILLMTVLACTFTLTDYAYATEGGGGAYANGSEDFMAGALPPPGTYFLNYTNYYTASRFNDKDGNEMLPNFKVDVVADVLRVVHVTKYKILGANWGVHAILPIVLYEKVRMFDSHDNAMGIGNLVINPFILGWHWKNFHLIAGVDTIIPIGTYDKDEMANPGRHYWTFEPIVAMTYLSDQGIELSGKFMYDFNTKNQDTDYLSGQEFHFDYTVGYHVNKDWALGLGGYYYQQITDDELHGSKVAPDGFKGQVFAVGPQAMYNYKNMSFTLKWQIETLAENRPEGNSLWLKFAYAF